MVVRAGEDRRPAGCAERVRGVAAVETCALGSDPVDVRRRVHPAAVGADGLRRVVVGQDEQDVRARPAGALGHVREPMPAGRDGPGRPAVAPSAGRPRVRQLAGPVEQRPITWPSGAVNAPHQPMSPPIGCPGDDDGAARLGDLGQRLGDVLDVDVQADATGRGDVDAGHEAADHLAVGPVDRAIALTEGGEGPAEDRAVEGLGGVEVGHRDLPPGDGVDGRVGSRSRRCRPGCRSCRCSWTWSSWIVVGFVWVTIGPAKSTANRQPHSTATFDSHIRHPTADSPYRC